MKKLVIIFGPPAVGKMTVGDELSNLSERLRRNKIEYRLNEKPADGFTEITIAFEHPSGSGAKEKRLGSSFIQYIRFENLKF